MYPAINVPKQHCQFRSDEIRKNSLYIPTNRQTRLLSVVSKDHELIKNGMVDIFMDSIDEEISCDYRCDKNNEQFDDQTKKSTEYGSVAFKKYKFKQEEQTAPKEIPTP